MLTVCALIFYSVVYTAGNPLKVDAYGKDKHRKEDVISNLELLIPLKENQHHKNKKLKHLRASSSGHHGVLSDGPYSEIPGSEFVLDDTAVYFKEPQKTTKKDLSQVDAQSQEQNDPILSAAQSSSKALLQKCRKYLAMELLRSQWESILEHPLKNEESHSADQELLLSLCRVQLGLANKHIEVGGEGGVSGNVAVNGHGRMSGNVGIKGTGGVAGNVGMGGKSSHTRNTGAGTAWRESLAVQMLNGMGFNSGNLGIDGQGGVAGNAGFNGEGGSAGNIGIGGKGGQAGNLGVGGKGGIVGNLGIGGQGGFFGNVGIGSNANQYFDLYSGFGQGNFLDNLVPGLQNQAAKYKGVKKFSFAYPATNEALEFDHKENDMQLGLGGSFVSNGGLGSGAVGNGEQHGNVGAVGAGGVAGNVVVGGTGGEIDNVAVAGQSGYVGNLNVEGEANEGNVVLGGQGTVPNDFVANQANKEREEIVSQNLKQVARNDNRLDQNNVQCNVGSLAFGGKGGQVGNLAIGGGAMGNSQYPSCGHSYCILVYLILNPKEAKSGGDSRSLSLLPEGEQVASQSSLEKLNVVGAGKVRQINGRRDWMMLDNKIDPRLRQYIDSRKPWLIL